MLLATAIVCLVLLDSCGSLLLAAAMKQLGPITIAHPLALLQLVGQAMRIPLLWLGGLCQVAIFFLLLWLFSWADLSVVVPLASTSYVTSVLGARWILREMVTPERWLGAVLIGIGIALISLTASG